MTERCSRDVVDALLAAGAKVELLNGLKLPSVKALRRLLQLWPDEIKAKFPAEAILREENLDLLSYVELMREFDYPSPPELAGMEALHTFRVECALFTFGYRKRPLCPDRHSLGSYLRWRPHTLCIR